ncbi:MAG: hypothetical protein HY301_12685 [Verrucomicrobia bacterium]|nr:hypothetical protein [Verrucomicrobiota bacterium]
MPASVMRRAHAFRQASARIRRAPPRAVAACFAGGGAHDALWAPGNDGAPGLPGDKGDKGDQGNPGEVSNSDLNNAISGTSNNTNGVGTPDTPMADPDPETLR